MSNTTTLTDAIVGIMKLYARKGLTTSELYAMLPRYERKDVSKTLWNLRARGRLRSTDCEPNPAHIGRPVVRWFPDFTAPRQGEQHTVFLPWNEARAEKQIERARWLDERHPLIPYASGLMAPGSSSVWAYARHFAEAA